MKISTLLILFQLFCLTLVFGQAGSNKFEDFVPQLSTNTPIVWQAPTSQLPKSLWVYRRLLPRVFPAAVISNAVVLASLQDKGIPQPSTNRTTIWVDHLESDPMPGCLTINPDIASIGYSKGHLQQGSWENVPDEKTVIQRAWNIARQLGLNPSQLMPKSVSSTICDYDDAGHANTNHQVCERGLFMSRLLDGIDFWDDETEGFCVYFGSNAAIRSFGLTWPELRRDELRPVASPQQIIACIRARKLTVLPDGKDGGNYFARINSLSKAEKFTITKVTPYYKIGSFFETNDLEMSKYDVPVAELEAVADFGTSNVAVRLFSPILAPDASRLLAK
ncbi:MAG TPA: hypothetical protein VHG89_00260 [Verrucomicrobiae bacterium]|nr:hypothetical protein [Verrucomicrobiae bacterium]